MARRQLGFAVLCVSIALGACATGDASAPSSESASSARAPRGVAPPSSSPLARVTSGMSEAQVREVAGNPTSQTTYMTGKAWIPFYFGPTHQTDYKYKGQGRVIFALNRWSGAAKVIRVDYDPSEDGA